MSLAVEVVAPPGFERAHDPVADLVRAALVSEGVADGSVTVAFVDEREMTDLNRRFRQLNEPTDVLSFSETGGGREWPDPGKDSDGDLGEIEVCVSVVKRYALEEGGDPETQLGWTLVHGVLHLMAYDHESDEERMRARERALLAELAPEVRAVSAAARW